MNHPLAVRLLVLALLCGVAISELLDSWGETRLAYATDIYHPLAHQSDDTKGPLLDSSPSIDGRPPMSTAPVLSSQPIDTRPVRASWLSSDAGEMQRRVFRLASSTQGSSTQPPASPMESDVGPLTQDQDKTDANRAEVDQQRLDSLVRQLGDEDFSQRELATAELTRIGIPAMEALENVSDHPDREVRYRATRILTTIRKVHLEQRLQQFLRGESFSNEAELPGWQQFQTLVGDDEKTRQFFVELQKQEYRLLAALHDEPAETAKALAQRTAQLYSLFRDPNDRLNEHTIGALLLLAGAEDVTLDEQTYVSLYYLCNNAGFHDAVKQGRHRSVFQKLLSPWLTKADWGTAYQSLVMGLRYDVPAVKSIAKDILTDREHAATHVQRYAIEAIAKFGDPSDVALLAPILQDDTRLHARSLGEHSLVAEMRDLALAASIHLVGEQVSDFGFKYVALHEDFVFVDSSVGFESDTQRDAAFAKWREFCEQKKSPEN